MKVRAIKNFYDLKRKQDVKAGDEFDVSEERARELSTANNRAGYAVCEVLADVEKVEKKPKTKKEA